MRLEARAKINLTLEVLGQRPDGYHEVATVLQTLEMADTLFLTPAPALSLTCSEPSLASQGNLVARAVRLLHTTIGAAPGARLHLEKRIPVASGLGGGSSDAAAALVGLNRLWDLHLPHARLLDLAATLGSDVPFFLLGGTAVARGRGEVVEPLSPFPTVWVVLAVPPLAIPGKTAALYRQLTPGDYEDGSATQRLVSQLQVGAAVDRTLLANSFTRAALAAYPEIAACRERMLAAGAPLVQLSGSGPALYSLMDSQEQAARVHDQTRGEGMRVYLTRTWNPDQEYQEG